MSDFLADIVQAESTRFVCDACRRSFVGGGALNYHTRTCRATKKRAGNALEKVREAWQQTRAKKRRIDLAESSSSMAAPSHEVLKTPLLYLIFTDY